MMDFPSATVMIQSWPIGPRGPSLRVIVYAILEPSGENCTAPTERIFKKSSDLKFAGKTIPVQAIKDRIVLYIDVEYIQ